LELSELNLPSFTYSGRILPLFDQLPEPGTTGKKVDGKSLALEFVGLSPPVEGLRPGPGRAANQLNSGQEWQEFLSIHDVDLDAAADFPGVLVKGWPVGEGSEPDPGEPETVQRTGEPRRIDPGGAYDLERTCRAPALAKVRSLEQAATRVDGCRTQGGHVGGGQDPGQPGLVEPHPAVPSLHGHDPE